MKLKTDQNVTVYYFSGTGNTQIIARKIVETFKNKGFTATLISIEGVGRISIKDNEIIGLGFPIAGFTTYPIFFDFINKIENVNGNYVFAFDTMGGTSLWGLMGKLKTILEKKGFKTLGYREFTMPLNLLVKFPENWRRNRINKSFKRAENFVQELVKGTSKWRKIPVISEIMSKLSHELYNLTEYKWHQKLFKMKVYASKCNTCGICASKCPNKNIKISKIAEIEDHCLYCFRCVGVCPSRAISGIVSPRSLHYLAEGAHL
jgi:flavodoxin/ferredoxin